MLLFLIAMCIISKGPVSQHFSWLFGWETQKTLKNSEISGKIAIKKREDR